MFHPGERFCCFLFCLFYHERFLRIIYSLLFIALLFWCVRTPRDTLSTDFESR